MKILANRQDTVSEYRREILSSRLSDALEWQRDTEKTAFICDFLGISVNSSQFDYYSDQCESHFNRLLKRSITLPIANCVTGKDINGKPTITNKNTQKRLTQLQTVADFAPVTLAAADQGFYGTYCPDPCYIEPRKKITNGEFLVIALSS